MNDKFISGILVLALGSMACGFSVDLPTQREAGPDVEETISVEVPDSDETRLSLSFGAGELKLSSGSKNLVDGTALYNVADFKPEIIEDGADITIKQGDFDGIPLFDNMKNLWDLQLGKAPMDLVIEAGAYEGTLDLGGLSLKSLTVNDGAADVELSFTQPNLVEMSQFTYTTGASEVKMEGLANANFKTFVFNGGAGDYTL
ncbi:MAG TPA: toast rack family protein, partial [Anaerolineales bacterium]|nr:toast rack family protein [Anaerolineales bacterium]